MAVTNPRTHLVSFRLTENEYGQLQRLCNEQGARSLADLVRTLVCRFMDQSSSASSQHGRMPRLLSSPAPNPLSAGIEHDTNAATTENLVALLFYLRRDMEWLDQELRSLAGLLRGYSASSPGRLLEFQSAGPVEAARSTVAP
ncbi:MAG: hypothetical protein IT159_15175 [Bryobacterales bacterium]|nr:hypothetical protein [Bryobacterales bacterium]